MSESVPESVPEPRHPRVDDERLARLLDSGAITAEIKLWRGTGVEHTSVEDVLLDLRDARAALRERDAMVAALRAAIGYKQQ